MTNYRKFLTRHKPALLYTAIAGLIPILLIGTAYLAVVSVRHFNLNPDNHFILLFACGYALMIANIYAANRAHSVIVKLFGKQECSEIIPRSTGWYAALCLVLGLVVPGKWTPVILVLMVGMFHYSAFLTHSNELTPPRETKRINTGRSATALIYACIAGILPSIVYSMFFWMDSLLTTRTIIASILKLMLGVLVMYAGIRLGSSYVSRLCVVDDPQKTSLRATLYFAVFCAFALRLQENIPYVLGGVTLIFSFWYFTNKYPLKKTAQGQPK